MVFVEITKKKKIKEKHKRTPECLFVALLSVVMVIHIGQNIAKFLGSFVKKVAFHLFPLDSDNCVDQPEDC